MQICLKCVKSLKRCEVLSGADLCVIFHYFAPTAIYQLFPSIAMVTWRFSKIICMCLGRFIPRIYARKEVLIEPAGTSIVFILMVISGKNSGMPPLQLFNFGADVMSGKRVKTVHFEYFPNYNLRVKKDRNYFSTIWMCIQY